jgi:hypothetical protein
MAIPDAKVGQGGGGACRRCGLAAIFRFVRYTIVTI